mgnify:CR=1 FL=1
MVYRDLEILSCRTKVRCMNDHRYPEQDIYWIIIIKILDSNRTGKNQLDKGSKGNIQQCDFSAWPQKPLRILLITRPLA